MYIVKFSLAVFTQSRPLLSSEIYNAVVHKTLTSYSHRVSQQWHGTRLWPVRGRIYPCFVSLLFAMVLVNRVASLVLLPAVESPEHRTTTRDTHSC